jgi:hypothetical protein
LSRLTPYLIDPGIPPQSAATQEILTTSFRAEPDRPHTEFHISHSLSNCNNEAWIRHRLIDSKEPILFVGESKNRSLPVALAIMRESWDGIWASSLDKRETQTLPALLASAQERSRINSRILGRLSELRVHFREPINLIEIYVQRNRHLGSRCQRCDKIYPSLQTRSN